MAYLTLTLAGVTHVDLLLNSPVTLPIVNVNIPLFSFFLAAPFLFLLVHLGLLVQHAMLAHKYQHFAAAIAPAEEGQAGDHPDRRLVHSYVFSQLLAGPKPPRALSILMRLMVVVTLSLLPVLVLLYFQIKFLPTHDVATTHVHRIAILLDLALLFVVRPFIAMPYLRPQGRKLRLGNQSWRWEMSYASLAIAGSSYLVVVAFSLLVATVPHGCFWSFAHWPEDQSWIEERQAAEEQRSACFSLDRTAARWWPVEVQSGEQTREVFAPTEWLFEGVPNEITSAPESLFSRNLVVTDRDLVARKHFEEGETSLPLRGRDLRFAVLDRSDFSRADLFGSDLRGVSAIGTQLDHAVFQKARMERADLRSAQMQGASLAAARMQGANLTAARMQGADLQAAHMQGADLLVANMQGANLARVRIWQTTPPIGEANNLAVPMARETIAPLINEEKSWVEALITEAQDEVLQMRLRGELWLLLDTNAALAWETSRDHKAWAEFSSRSKPDPADLSAYLAELACTDNSGGYITEGIAQRLFRGKDPFDELVAKFTAARLINDQTCPAAKHLSEKSLARLREIAAREEAEAAPTPAQ